MSVLSRITSATTSTLSPISSSGATRPGEGQLTGTLTSAVRGTRGRLADAGLSIVETPVAAGLAWYIAHSLLGHPEPFFAPAAAALSLSKDRVLRGQHALQLIAGVTLGIASGTAVKALAGPDLGGSGAVAITAAVAIAMAAALAFGGGFLAEGALFVNQSATSAILMIAVAGAATATERWSDALVGGGVTLMITVVMFPAAPLSLIRDAVRRLFAELRDTVAQLADQADTGKAPGPEWVLATGERVQHRLASLQKAQTTARQVASLAPRRWPERPRVRQAAEDTAHLHLLAASVLSLGYASTAWTADSAARPSHSAGLSEALRELALAFAALATGDDASTARAAAHAIRAQALATSGARASGGSYPELIARLAEACADATLRFNRETRAESPLRQRSYRKPPPLEYACIVTAQAADG
jgi:uncharacterized membrane protein YgaE (UPF0421/DUF939 family)